MDTSWRANIGRLKKEEQGGRRRNDIVTCERANACVDTKQCARTCGSAIRFTRTKITPNLFMFFFTLCSFFSLSFSLFFFPQEKSYCPFGSSYKREPPFLYTTLLSNYKNNDFYDKEKRAILIDYHHATEYCVKCQSGEHKHLRFKQL